MSRLRTRYPLGLALAVLAGVIGWATLQLRDQTRRQIVARDAEVFHAVALLHADDPEVSLLGIEDPLNQLGIILKTSDLKSVSRDPERAVVQWRVLAARLFSAEGQYVAGIPDNVVPVTLPSEVLPALRRLEPSATFHRAQLLSSISTTLSGPSTNARVPILEITVPLHTSENSQLAGIAQFLIEGESMASQFERLDRNLIWQALVGFCVSGTLLGAAISWSFRRLRASNRLLAIQAQHLRQANLELALAAKTNALGTVTAHLLHGLKSPLSGLQNFMNSLRLDENNSGDYECAVASTRRMQAMINQVVNILRENQGGSAYEVTAQEILQQVREQVQATVQETAVDLDLALPSPAAWPNRVAQLTVLVLTNLVQNALQASPPGARIQVETESTANVYRWKVKDQGAGFPDEQEPFAPCQSSKTGGTGIGLALSKQLANHLQANLELVPNLPHGCIFSLSLPTSLQAGKSERAAFTEMR